MKKLILLGAISPFCDLVKEFEALKIEPYICDYYPDAPAKSMGHPSFNISTTDSDNLIALAEREGADGCVSAFSDRNIIPCIEVCNHLKTNYFFDRKTVERFIDKQKMKAFFEEIGVPVLKYAVVRYNSLDESLANFSFPVVTKPIDAYGSKGITVCENLEEVKKAFADTVKESKDYTDKIIVEEYYPADEISITAWVKSSNAYITCIYDVFRNKSNGITLSAVSFPSKYTEGYYDRLKELLNYIIRKSGIKEGPVTLQCFIGNRGLMVSELLCRLAGGSPYLYSVYLGGPNIAKMLIQNAAGEEIDYQNLESFVPVTENGKIFFDIQVQICNKGKIYYEFEAEKLFSEFPELVDIRVYYKNGAELINVPSGGVNFARLFYKTNKSIDYLNLISRLDKAVRVNDENGEKLSFIRVPEQSDFNRIFNF